MPSARSEGWKREDNYDKPLSRLTELADKLLQRRAKEASHIVVSFVGAGASASAHLPTGEGLRNIIHTKLVNKYGEPLAKLLDEEALLCFKEKAKDGILKLSLFEFVAVLSGFKALKAEMRDMIRAELDNTTHRPLVYELLAHLAKHQFLDHFVSLNFDELLDQALEDELPDRLHTIKSPEEIPGPNQQLPAKVCHLVKPFGSLSTDRYQLEPEEVTHYEPGSTWDFINDTVFKGKPGDASPEVVLILIGYRAVEGVFGQLISGLLSEKKQRNVTVFFINKGPSLPPVLVGKEFSSSVRFKAVHVQLEAEVAFDLLLQVMESKCKDKDPDGVWIPVARHRVISALAHDDIENPDKRFRVEVLLQAIKSRGFFTIEAVADIRRIRKYDRSASAVIDRMCKENVLILQNPTYRTFSPKNLRQDFRLVSDQPGQLMEHMTKLPSGTPTTERRVARTGQSYKAYSRDIPLTKFLKNRFAEISKAPEIEVSSGSRSTHWLFKNATAITSISDLTERTNAIFRSALQSGEEIELKGVWTTGEWLFHEEGWAWKSIGKPLSELLRSGRASIRMVVAKGPKCQCERSKRAKAVVKRLRKFKTCDVTFLDWWKLNRCITLLHWGQRYEGIYMRRHLATPLVAPVCVSGEECKILEDMFDLYLEKAAEGPRQDLRP